MRGWITKCPSGGTYGADSSSNMRRFIGMSVADIISISMYADEAAQWRGIVSHSRIYVGHESVGRSDTDKQRHDARGLIVGDEAVSGYHGSSVYL